MTYVTDDIRIRDIQEVLPPVAVHENYPLTETAAATTYYARQGIQRILHNQDSRLFIVVGPCSIHDPIAALEYAGRLQTARESLQAQLHIIMRVYFEKPRTTVGWKGLINDPDLDGSFHINKGLCMARKLLRDINDIGVPTATEFLDLITPQYIADLISWGAIGARTTESQVHRELASGLSCPVGFKNGTDGRCQIAIDAIRAAQQPHHFLSLTKAGHSAIFSTTGNPDSHIILRGGKTPNYDRESVQQACHSLEKAGLSPNLMIDFSHANSSKQYLMQQTVGMDVAQQIREGNSHIVGVMIESHLHGGRQDLIPGQPLKYGQSVTDACLSWEQTLPILEQLAEAVEKRKHR